MARALKTLTLIIFLNAALFSKIDFANAGDCAQTCVTVTREGGELVITAKRDPVKRKPLASASPSPSPTHSPVTTTRKSASKRKAKPRPSLSDQIREALPAVSFSILPRSGALIWEPLLIHQAGCAPVRKTLPILDTSITLDLQPTIQWRWGDGSSESWEGGRARGAHIYQRPGRYLIEIRCAWQGRFRTPSSNWMEIPPGIISSSRQSVELFRARVFFTE